MIALQNINKTFSLGEETIYALNSINFKVQKGEFVSIIGPSGSRKINFNEYFGVFRCTNVRNICIR